MLLSCTRCEQVFAHEAHDRAADDDDNADDDDVDDIISTVYRRRISCVYRAAADRICIIRCSRPTVVADAVAAVVIINEVVMFVVVP